MKINIKLDTRYKRKDGKYPLKISIFRENRTLYIPLDIFIQKDEWDKKKGLIKSNKSLDIFIHQKMTDIEMRLLSLQHLGSVRLLSDKQLIDSLLGVNDNDRPHYFHEYMNKYISSLPNIRTREIYIATENKLRLYCDYDTITFEDMTVSWIKLFDTWMAEKKLAINTRSIHLRNIRAVFNEAIDDDCISCYPFRRFRIKNQETAKRSIKVEDFRKFMSVPVKPFQEKYRDCFLLMFYLIGINIADLANLQTIEDGRIKYYRAKTHKLYDIKVEKEAQEIIDRYKGKSHLLCFFDNIKSYKNFAMHLNQNLERIAKDNGLPKITTYVSRHSWSTYASELDIPRDVIAHALGHSQTVTDIYIRFNKTKVDNANRRVIDYLLDNKEDRKIHE